MTTQNFNTTTATNTNVQTPAMPTSPARAPQQAPVDPKVAKHQAYLSQHHLTEGLVRLWKAFDNGEFCSNKNGKTYHSFGFYGKSFGEGFSAKSRNIKLFVQVTPNSAKWISYYQQFVNVINASGKKGYVVSANWSDSQQVPQILSSFFNVDQTKFDAKHRTQATQQQAAAPVAQMPAANYQTAPAAPFAGQQNVAQNQYNAPIAPQAPQMNQSAQAPLNEANLPF